MSNIVARNLSKTYRDGKLSVAVFDDINLCIAEGEMVGVVGASGVGKSTLLQLLGGLDQPTSGEVLICGQNITLMRERAKGLVRNHLLGFIYQFHHLLPEFNALENVCMPLLIRGMNPKQATHKATEFICRVGLADRLEHRIGELSGGERQRIAIARALVTEPKCVLADEPTGNLDSETSDQVFQLMLQLNRELNTSFVVVTHNHQLAKRMDRVLTLTAKNLTECEKSTL